MSPLSTSKSSALRLAPELGTRESQPGRSSETVPSLSSSPKISSDILETLRRKVSHIERHEDSSARFRASTGCPFLDLQLPGRGLTGGTFVEWIEQQPGSGGGWLSWRAAASILTAFNEPYSQAHNSGGHRRLVVIDIQGDFHPAAAIATGLSLEQIIVVRPNHWNDGFWAADQALRNPSVGVVWAAFPKMDDFQSRRLQLAAEQGGGIGLWVLPQSMFHQPSWADIRWHVRSVPRPTSIHASHPSDRFLEVRLLRCRGGHSGQRNLLRIDSHGEFHEEPIERKEAAMHLATKLAYPTAARHRTQQRRGA